MSDYWKDNGIEKPQAVVVCAACRMGKHIVLGARHFDAPMRQQMSNTSCNWKLAEQGFINQFGEFLTREEAVKVVHESGQQTRTEKAKIGDALFSEDLY